MYSRFASFTCYLIRLQWPLLHAVTPSAYSSLPNRAWDMQPIERQRPPRPRSRLHTGLHRPISIDTSYNLLMELQVPSEQRIRPLPSQNRTVFSPCVRHKIRLGRQPYTPPYMKGPGYKVWYPFGCAVPSTNHIRLLASQTKTHPIHRSRTNPHPELGTNPLPSRTPYVLILWLNRMVLASSCPVVWWWAYRYYFGTPIWPYSTRHIVTRAKKQVPEMWTPTFSSDGKVMTEDDG